jgi:hypothetical protein
MAIKTPLHYVALSRQFISSEATKLKYKAQPQDFTRNRKLGFKELSLFMLRTLRQNIQVELLKYLGEIRWTIISFTSSAFVQSRKKIKPDMFRDLNSAIAGDFYVDNNEAIELYRGHRLLSIDGSTINLPLNTGTIEVYGFCNNQKKTDDVVIARVSVLYDVLNEIVIDGQLSPYRIGEISLSRQQLNLVQRGDIVIMDRAYANFEAMHQMFADGIHFIYRCKASYSGATKRFLLSGKSDEIMIIKPGQNRSFKGLNYDKTATLTIRMLRISLQSGEQEILMTSLLDKLTHPHEDFAELYSKRWGIETYYNRLKNIIGVEHFSGTSPEFILQEFYCALYMSNMQSILTMDAQREAKEKYRNRAYEYKINASLSLCFIRNKLIELFTSKRKEKEIMEELTKLFVTNVIPIRPDRSFKRNVDKYRQRTKPKQFHNRKINL